MPPIAPSEQRGAQALYRLLRELCNEPAGAVEESRVSLVVLCGLDPLEGGRRVKEYLANPVQAPPWFREAARLEEQLFRSEDVAAAFCHLLYQIHGYSRGRYYLAALFGGYDWHPHDGDELADALDRSLGFTPEERSSPYPAGSSFRRSGD